MFGLVASVMANAFDPETRRNQMDSFRDCYAAANARWNTAVRLFVESHPGSSFKGVTRRFERWRKEDPDFAADLEQVKDELVETAQQFLVSAITNPGFKEETRLGAAKFLLDRLGATRGWGPPEQNVNVNTNAPLAIHIVPASMLQGEHDQDEHHQDGRTALPNR